MKICFITTNIYSIGGVQRVLTNLSNLLIKNYEIDILCTEIYDKSFKDYYNLDSNINVRFIGRLENSNIIKENIYKKIIGVNKRTKLLKKNYKLLKEVYFSSEVRKELIRFLNNEDYSVVIGVEGFYSLLVAIISSELTAKTIGWYHNSYEAYFLTPNKYYWNMELLFEKYINLLDQCVVLTNHDKERNKMRMGVNTIAIYNPLSFESRDKAKLDKKNILCVARLDKEQKGLDLLIDAFELVVKKNDDWNLIIVGEGKDEDVLKQQIKEKNLEDRISIKPHQINITDYYLDASIFVSSSRWEGFGLVITEAMECGLPVIAFNNTGPNEILAPNNSGILVERNNIIELSEAIYELIIDSNKRQEISQKSLSRVEIFKKGNIYNEWKDLINNIIY